ncbi:MAG: CDP-alcohol phosphatidyltransferase family protein, partial [Candidatus Kerfeldbacteria bacterium]|nr:CDP-alcohol phosphatidyltransferase family protein [Candidatus Kerfeldbacteria bacterium]
MPNVMIPPIDELRARCQKPLAYERLQYARFTRRYSIYLTWVLLHTPVTPNQVTVIQLLCYVAGSAMIAIGSMWWLIAGLVFLHVGYALDCVDGEIARFREIASRMGVFLDSFTHVFTIPLIIFAFSWHVFATAPFGTWPLLVGFFTATLSISPA